MVRKGGKRIQTQEEKVLYDNGGTGKKRCRERVGRFLNARPGQVDVKEKKEDP